MLSSASIGEPLVSQQRSDQSHGFFLHIRGDATGFSSQKGGNDQYGDGYGQTQLGGDERFADAAGHKPWVSGPMNGDDMKGIDHSGDGSQKTQKGGDGGQHFEGGEESFQARGFLKDGFGQAAFNDVPGLSLLFKSRL